MERVPSLFVVSEFVDKKNNSTGYYWNKIIQGLESKFNTNVISLLSSNENAINDFSSVKFINIDSNAKYNKNSLIVRAFSQLKISFLFFISILRNVKKQDAIFSGTNPSFLLVFISLAKKFVNFRWILLVHDVFPENLVASKILRKNTMIYKFLYLLFNATYRMADELIVIGTDMEDLLKQKLKKAKITYVPNWVDVNDICSNDKNTIDEKKIVFQFFGNIGRVQGIDFLLEVIKKVQNHKAHFVFSGHGTEVNKLQDFIKNNSTSRISYKGPVSFENNTNELFNCDIAIVTLTNGMRGLAVPSKAYFSIAADRPILVISEENTELHNLVKSNRNIGWFIENKDPALVAKFIDQLCELDLKPFKGFPRNIAIKRYDVKIALKAYTEIIQKYL